MLLLYKMDFIGIGLSRCGTTWTWRQIVKHPSICPSKKEFWAFKPNQDLDYQAILHERFHHEGLKGQWNPEYLHHRSIADKIKRLAPNAKLLLTLRNPIDRIWSQYKAKQWRIHRGPARLFKDWFDHHPKHRRYIEELPYWIGLFGSQLHITLYDDLVGAPLSYLWSIYRHLGVTTFTPPDYLVREQKAYNKYFNKNPIYMSQEDRKLVKIYYQDQILRVQDLIGRNLSHWK